MEARGILHNLLAFLNYVVLFITKSINIASSGDSLIHLDLTFIMTRIYLPLAPCV
jgi:hypothetical protein